MRYYQLKCPSCNAVLNIEEGKSFAYCGYCGNKLLVDDGTQRSQHTIRDEARMREAEAFERVQLKELELEQEWRANRKRSIGYWWRICLGATVVGLVLYGVNLLTNNHQIGLIAAIALCIGLVGFTYGGLGYFIALILHNSKRKRK